MKPGKEPRVGHPCYILQCSDTMMLIGVRGGGSGGRLPTPRAWKFSGQTLFSGQAQFAQKSRMIKDISIQWKIPGQLCFQGKRKLLKNPECQKYIQYSENFQATLCFSGQAQLAQKSWM